MTDWVKNLNGTTGKRPALGHMSHRQALLHITDTTSRRCSVVGCNGPPDVAGHVKFIFMGDHRHYLMLLCYGHNNLRGQDLEVRENSARMLANERELRRELAEDYEPEPPRLTTGEKFFLGTCATIIVGGVGALLWDALRTKPPVAPPPPPMNGASGP